MPNEIDDKLAQCQRAQRALALLRKRQDVDEFEYHFCAFISFFGAIRQYIQERLRPKLESPHLETEQTWLQALESDDDVAAVIGLRNTDVHRSAVSVSNQLVKVAVSEKLRTSASFSAVARDASGEIFASRGSVSEPTPEASDPATSAAIDFYYRLDPATLPADFMTTDRDRNDGRIAGSKVKLKKGDDLQMKASVVSHLAGTDLGSVAAAALAKLEAAIIGARSGSPPISI